MASTLPEALRYARSGAITSTPSACSALENMRPQSITTRSPPDSTTMQFIPTSPRPPSGMMRTGAGSGTDGLSYGDATTATAHREDAKGAKIREVFFCKTNLRGPSRTLRLRGVLLLCVLDKA